jgi:hypothetical protein
MRMILRSLWVALALTTFGDTQPASASLIGTSWNVGFFLPDTSTPYPFATEVPSNFVVGAGIESHIDVEGILDIQVDFTDTAINIFFTKLTPFQSQWLACPSTNCPGNFKRPRLHLVGPRSSALFIADRHSATLHAGFRQQPGHGDGQRLSAQLARPCLRPRQSEQ